MSSWLVNDFLRVEWSKPWLMLLLEIMRNKCYPRMTGTRSPLLSEIDHTQKYENSVMLQFINKQ